MRRSRYLADASAMASEVVTPALLALDAVNPSSMKLYAETCDPSRDVSNSMILFNTFAEETFITGSEPLEIKLALNRPMT